MTGRRLWVVLGAILLLALGTGAGFLLRGDGHPPSATAGAVDGSSATAGAVDVGFAQDMSVHHQQAVDMATSEVLGGSDPAVKNLAFDILTSQQNQIGRLQGWLTAWDAPLLPTGGYMGWMGHGSDASMPGMATASMPGMATTAELTALRRAAPAARDVLFLQLMLRHHEGGAHMLVAGAEKAETGYVRDLARQMSATQSSEGALMTRMLRERDAAPLPLR